MIYFHTSVVLFTSGYVLLTTSYGIYMYALAAISISIMLGDIILSKVKLNTTLLMFLIVTLLVTVFSSFVNHGENSINSVIKMSIILIFSFLYCSRYTIREAARTFLDIMYVVAAISLVLYFSINMLNLSVPSMQVVNSNDIIYHYLGFYSYFDGFMQFRNNSIFWEPGIFASFLIFSLYLEMYFYDNRRLLRIFVFFVSLITTLSSAGIVLFLLYLASNFCKYRVSLKAIVIFILGGAIIFGSIFMVLDVINSHAIDPMRSINKLLNPSETESHRMNSPLNLLNIFTMHPFFGMGLDGAFNEYSKLGSISLTSTSLIYLASFGMMSIVFIAPAIAFMFLWKKSFAQALLIILVYFLVINKELHLYFISQYLIMFYIISSLNINKELDNE